MATSYSSGFVENWQEGKTVTECNLRMLEEEDSCDVTFRCGTKGHVVKAHRYMLISRSRVFHAMLTGAMAQKSDVKIPDIEPLVFKTFLMYIYTDDTDINAENVTALLYTARKYGLNTLKTKCTEFLGKKRDKTMSGYTSKSRFLSMNYREMRTMNEIDAIRFTTNENILIVGCQLYGDSKGTYNVTSYLGDEDNVMSCVVQERTEYTSEGEVFDVIFSRPVSVSARKWYTLAVKICVLIPAMWRGRDGQEKVVCDDGVKLQFRDSKHSNNGSIYRRSTGNRTNTHQGQIPSLIYRKC